MLGMMAQNSLGFIQAVADFLMSDVALVFLVLILLVAVAVLLNSLLR